MNRTRGNPYPAKRSRRRIKQCLEVLFSLYVRKPTKGGDDTTGKVIRDSGELKNCLDPLVISTLKGQNRGSKDLSRTLLIQSLLTNLPTGFAGNTQSINVGSHAIVKACQV